MCLWKILDGNYLIFLVFQLETLNKKIKYKTCKFINNKNNTRRADFCNEMFILLNNNEELFEKFAFTETKQQLYLKVKWICNGKTSRLFEIADNFL